jgi:hypothetical protein
MEHQKIGSIYSIVLCTVLCLAVVKDKCEILTLNYGLHAQLISFVDSLSYHHFQGKPVML